MCSRHRPENGADSEPLDARDTFCDLCARTIRDGSLRAETLGGSTLWTCGDCRARARARYASMVGDAPEASA